MKEGLIMEEKDVADKYKKIKKKSIESVLRNNFLIIMDFKIKNSGEKWEEYKSNLISVIQSWVEELGPFSNDVEKYIKILLE